MFLSLEGEAADNVAELITKKYVASEPVVKGAGLELGKDGEQNIVTSTVTSADVCTQINKSAGAATPAAVTAIGDLPYGCITEGSVFKFKF
jgi:hypothetical protein